MNRFKVVVLVAAFALVGVAFASGAGSQNADDPDRGVGESGAPPASGGDVGNDDRDQTGEGGALDQVILDDLIVDGSACVGFDCVNGESFGFDTIRIKENNLRIRAVDTSTSASFPTRDWQITFNDSSNGGGEYFAIDDLDGGRQPFRIEAGARSNALYVKSNGKIGIGTSVPVSDIHIKTGNTPTVRLDQDGSSGFTAQTWDVAGNEANFFVRDATNGSRLPFRIRPGAETGAIDIQAAGHVSFSEGIGINTGTSALEADTVLDVRKTGTNLMSVQSTDGGAVQWRIRTDNENRRIVALNAAGTQHGQIEFRNDGRIRFGGAGFTNDGSQGVSFNLTTRSARPTAVKGTLYVQESSGALCYFDGSNWTSILNGAVATPGTC